MKALLDTHAFLWWNTNDSQLSETARGIISDGRNEIFLSAASAWEIAIKFNRGRLVLPEPPEKYVSSRMLLHHFQALPVQVSHALHVCVLPDYHRDPFDRMLIAQARLEKLSLLTSDSEIARYDVTIVW